MIFVTYNGVLSVPWISDRLLGYYPLSLDHHHIFALIIITSACQHELRLLLFVCLCGARWGEYILSPVTLSLAESCICMGKHTFRLIQSTNHEKARYNFHKFCIFLFLFQTFIVAKLDLFKVCVIHFIFHWLIYFRMWCLHELYIYISHTHWLITSLGVVHLVTVVRCPHNNRLQFNFLVQSVESEAPLEWREAGVAWRWSNAGFWICDNV